MKRVIYSVFTALFTLSLCTSCSKQQKQMQTSEPIVQTTEVKSVQDSRRKEYSFTTRPFRTSELSFRVGGPIKSSTNYIGNYYRKGEVIATIDQRDFEIRKNRAEAVYNQAKAERSEERRVGKEG